MADKKIYEFPTLTEADDDDLLLVSSNNDTYNIKVETLKESVGVSISVVGSKLIINTPQ